MTKTPREYPGLSNSSKPRILVVWGQSSRICKYIFRAFFLLQTPITFSYSRMNFSAAKFVTLQLEMFNKKKKEKKAPRLECNTSEDKTSPSSGYHHLPVPPRAPTPREILSGSELLPIEPPLAWLAYCQCTLTTNSQGGMLSGRSAGCRASF